MKINFKKIMPLRPDKADKNFFGRVLIAAGSRGMTGAAYLACKAAYRSGAGIVYCALPESEAFIVSCLIPEAVIIALPSSRGFIKPRAYKIVSEKIKKFKIDVLALGPGLGEGGREFAVNLLNSVKIPCVIDADALNALAQNKEYLPKLKNRPCILTPHEGEMKRLIGDFSERIKAAYKLSNITSGAALLKGANSVVCEGKKVYVSSFASSALSKGGSGDVLTGITAAIWAQIGKQKKDFRKTAFQSAALSVEIHALAGKIAAEKIGERSLLASDIADFIGEAFKRIK
ncbi:MAG: NAD(P)H-hydrate dehydratase [Elusimicrobia bacterium]|nr:NAD(P)H-hydrate dehydratase [Elusimicrobiota bacterium]